MKSEEGVFSGRPRETRNHRLFRQSYHREPHLSTHELILELSLPQKVVYHYQILTGDLQLRTIISNLLSVIHINTGYRTARIKLFDQHGIEFLGSKMFVQDETWVEWDSKMRREVWVT